MSKATLTVKANNASRTYGAINPAFTPSYSGLVNGDTTAVLSGSPSLTTTATTSSPAGTYQITAAVGTLAATNYSFTFANGTLTVNKATLTVKANDASRTYGAANPTFTASYLGFVNGDTTAVLSGSPSLTTTATTLSPIGTFPITAAGGTLTAANYSLAFADGTLTVTKPVPASPANVDALASDNVASITLSWGAVEYANGYTVQRCSGLHCSNFANVATIAAPQTSFSDTALASHTAYQYRIYAYNEIGTSAASDVVAAMTTEVMSLDAPSVTTYTYDALDNLETVVNGSQQRTFVYDSYSQLTEATNPESGKVGYTYDSNGNLLTKTDARGQTISYCYDALNRVTGKRYAATVDCDVPSGFDVHYIYDVANGMSGSFPVGRRTGMRDQSGSTAWSYDGMGRPTMQVRTIGTVTKQVDYAYNADSSVESITYPSRGPGQAGMTLIYEYDIAGRPTSVRDTNGVYYVNSAEYWPHGALSEAVFGPVAIQNYYQNRLQPQRLTARAGSEWRLDLTYTYGDQNNGNIRAIIDNLDDSRTKQFTYDALNRIESFETWTCGNQYTIDPRGNLTEFGEHPGRSLCRGTTQAVDENNRLIGHAYDAAGNMTDGGAVYNAEGQLQSVAAAGVTYTYDGDGKRVQKSTGMTYWTGVGGDVLSESDVAVGNVSNEYIFFGGRRVARRESSGAVYYYLSDHLGSTQKLVRQDGTVCLDMEYDPFGNQIGTYVNTCQEHYKFTGKERDAETEGTTFGDGLDYFGARYFASYMGRFMSPDPLLNSGRPDNPQTWNRYAYTLNNPVTFADPTGLYELKNTCLVTDIQCNEYFAFLKERFREALNDVQDEYNKAVAAGDTEKADSLKQVLDGYGKEGEKNAFGQNVTVGLDPSQGNLGLTRPVGNNTIQVTFNLNLKNDWDHFKTEVAHEGSHAGQRNFSMRADNVRRTERAAYLVGGYMSQRYGRLDQYDTGNGTVMKLTVVWNPSWAKADANSLRQAGATKMGEFSAQQCVAAKECK